MPTPTNSSLKAPAPADALLAEVLAYRKGDGKYNFAHMNPSDRANAGFDAWADLETRIGAHLKAAAS